MSSTKTKYTSMIIGAYLYGVAVLFNCNNAMKSAMEMDTTSQGAGDLSMDSSGIIIPDRGGSENELEASLILEQASLNTNTSSDVAQARSIVESVNMSSPSSTMAPQEAVQNGIMREDDTARIAQPGQQLATDTSLLLAAQQGNVGEVKHLLGQGADVNAQDVVGAPPLHLAVFNGCKEIVELLLEAGADINVTDKDGNTSLYIAAQRGHKEIVELLLEAGADINATDEDGNTSLHIATQKGNKEIVELLLEKGADVNAQDVVGAPPLHLAVENLHKEVVEFLLKRKDIDVDFQYDRYDDAMSLHRETPLHIAVFNGCTETVKLLLEAGADINVTDERKNTSLHIAASAPHKEIVECLLDKSADINARNDKEQTPLHIAAQEGNKKIVKLLLEAGADINATDKDGNTSLHITAQKGHKKIVKYLLFDMGANRCAKNNNGQTPQYLAALYDHREVTQLFQISQE